MNYSFGNDDEEMNQKFQNLICQFVIVQDDFEPVFLADNLSEKEIGAICPE